MLAVALTAVVCLAAPAGAQLPPAADRGALDFVDAPAAPLPPATINRDQSRRATLRAVRVDGPLRLDGRLDEEVYRTVPPAGGFIQQVPREGAPATDDTDVWVLFDDNTLYLAMRCRESNPDRRVATERRRDAMGITNDDNVVVVLDTFYDRRNAFFFQTNPVGGVRDQLATDGIPNVNWNTVWDVRVADIEGGYSVEMEIPFKSLRYRGSGPQVWGINFRRTTLWKNETTYLNPVPVSYGLPGISQMSTAATLVGVVTPSRSLNLEAKPYAIGTVTTDRAARVPFNNDPDLNAGVDLKYGVTRSLTADFTVNTDFSQIEEDLQQVNLTRFNLLFPEKRDFFLEGQGLFAFAGRGTGGTADGASDVPTLFFSRRIGLNAGMAVPVLAGGRLTGAAGRFEVGLLNIHTDDSAAAGAVGTNFSVARIRRNVLRRSNVGVIATVRHPTAAARGDNAAYGVDANLRFYQNVEANLYAAGTSTPGMSDDENSYRARFNLGPDAYGLQIEHLKIGRQFNPEIGFVRRPDFRDTTVTGRYSPRLRKHPFIRQLIWTGRFEYATNSAADVLDNRDAEGSFAVDFHTGDRATLAYTTQYELVPGAFPIGPGVIVPRGGYDYDTLRATYLLGNRRRVSGTVSASHGSFYGGTRTAGSYTGRLSFSPRFVMEPGVTFNRVDLPVGRLTANLFSTRVVVTPSPRMGISGLVQFNPSLNTVTSSVRLRWEYSPGSELFAVYSDGRTTTSRGYPELLNRTVAVKVTRLVRF